MSGNRSESKMVPPSGSKRRKSSPWTYDHKEGGPLDVDREFYGKLTVNPSTHKIVNKFDIPIRTGN